jgi:hypothetical protein
MIGEYDDLIYNLLNYESSSEDLKNLHIEAADAIKRLLLIESERNQTILWLVQYLK